MVTLDVEVNPIVDVLYPAVVDGLNERVGVENGVSTLEKREEGYRLKQFIKHSMAYPLGPSHHQCKCL